MKVLDPGAGVIGTADRVVDVVLADQNTSSDIR